MLHVEHERVESLGQLLAHDAGRDERDRWHGAGDVAQGVELAIGRHEVGGGAADHAADIAADLLKLGRAEIRAKAGDGFELVERAAGRAEAAAGDHRHLQVAAGQQRRERQRNLVADAARRMLVDLWRLAGGPLERDAGVEHVLGERGDFGDRHAAQVHGHRPGRHLVVGHVAADVARDERTDFVFGQLAAVALFRDEADDVHI